MRALILAPFTEDQLGRLGGHMDVAYESWLATRKIQDPDELGDRLAADGTTVLVVESDFVFDETLARADALRFLGVCRNATDHVDIEAATRRGVLVVNTPGRNARAVAEHALGLMISLARKIVAGDAYVTRGRWQNPAEPYIAMRGVELGGRTQGIIGLGTVGVTLARFGSALGMNVVAYDPYVIPSETSVRITGLEALLARADFVCICAPLTPETEGMLDAARLAQVKPGAYLINVSEAAIVVEDALVDALAKRRLGGAALDVFETHPVDPNSPLLALDNVVLTPHVGGATAETVERHSKAMADDILHFVAGERPVNLVNPDAWGRRA